MKMFLGVLLAAGLGVGFVQQRRITELRTAIDDQEGPAAEAARLRRKNAEIPKTLPSAEQIAAMRAERSELMRLRAGIADLRIAAQTPDRIEAEIARLNEAAQRDENEARLFAARRDEEWHAKAVKAVLEALGNVTKMSARFNGGKPPRTFDEVKQGLAASQRFPNVEEVWAQFSKGYPPYNITKDSFEFLPPHTKLLLRERQPRQLPDGAWSRLYLTTDYKINEATLKDPDFASWEREDSN
jgi:hypothetical protein